MRQHVSYTAPAGVIHAEFAQRDHARRLHLALSASPLAATPPCGAMTN